MIHRFWHLLLVPLAIVMVVVGSGTIVVRSQSTSEENHLYLPALLNGSGQQLEADPEAVITSEVTEAETAAEAYWTRERLMSAEDLTAMPLQEQEGPGEYVSSADEVATSGSPELFTGQLPDSTALALAKEMYTKEWDDATDMLLEMDTPEVHGYGYVPPYTRYCVNCSTSMWTSFPWSTVGKLFFRIPGQGNYSCSAAVAYNRAVWTAGHCVYTRGRGWHTNVVFIPAYRNGRAPYGVFSASNLATTSGWFNYRRYSYDVGLIIARDRSRRSIGWWTGYLGAMFNARTDQHFHTLGYPSNISSGRYLIACASSTSRLDATESPRTVGIGCDMSHGSSGGPRMIKYTPLAAGANNYVNGVTSYYYRGRSLEVFSPYFGEAAKGLYYWGRKQ